MNLVQRNKVKVEATIGACVGIQNYIAVLLESSHIELALWWVQSNNHINNNINGCLYLFITFVSIVRIPIVVIL